MGARMAFNPRSQMSGEIRKKFQMTDLTTHNTISSRGRGAAAPPDLGNLVKCPLVANFNIIPPPRKVPPVFYKLYCQISPWSCFHFGSPVGQGWPQSCYQRMPHDQNEKLKWLDVQNYTLRPKCPWRDGKEESSPF